MPGFGGGCVGGVFVLLDSHYAETRPRVAEAPAFTRHLPNYLSDDEYWAVQEELGTNPELGDLMLSAGGFRKMRRAGSTEEITEDMLMAKRDIFGELMEGVAAMKSYREGKLTLRSYKVAAAPLPKVDSKLIRDIRKRLRCSRAVFARRLRINERTLEKWEQGRAKPNPQAAALVLVVRRYPDTLARLGEVAAR